MCTGEVELDEILSLNRMYVFMGHLRLVIPVYLEQVIVRECSIRGCLDNCQHGYLNIPF